MPEISDPIEARATVKSFRTDEDGEVLLTLRVPASDAVNVARLSIMPKIVFAVKFTPEDVANDEPSV